MSLSSASLGAKSSVPEVSETWCSCSSSVFACFLLRLTLSNLSWNLWLWLGSQSVCVCMYARSDCALGSILQNGTVLGFRGLVSVTVIEVTVYKHREGEKSCSVFCLTQWYSLDELGWKAVWFDLLTGQRSQTPMHHRSHLFPFLLLQLFYQDLSSVSVCPHAWLHSLLLFQVWWVQFSQNK